MHMNIDLPRDLFTQIHEDPAVNPASRRKVVLPRITRQVLESQGYMFGSKLRVPGGYAFEVTAPDGRRLKLGLKTAVNRWLNTATTLVERVDSVIVTTFVWDKDDEKPEALELIEISSAALLAMIQRVREEAIRLGKDPHGHYYMPLDPELHDEGQLGCIVGAVIPAGNRIFGPERVNWIASEWGRVRPDWDASGAPALPAPASPPVDVATIVAETKATLAARLGVPPSNIDLSIRF